MTELTALVIDSLGARPLIYTNDSGAFAYVPAEARVSVSREALARLYGSIEQMRLLGPTGWRIDGAEQDENAFHWRVRPSGAPPSCLVGVRLLIERADGGRSEVVHGLPIEIHGRTQFDPERDAAPFANSVAGLGTMTPDRAIFGETYAHALFGNAFFAGLYSRVVFLADSAAGPVGGLCTGIARSALERSYDPGGAPMARQGRAALRQMAQLWHGRQLADRALLASALAWLTRGSRDAYLAFQRDVLAHGRVDVAMDVNVPRLWRRDLLTAFVGNGHTVVPYALRQTSDDWADVWVYDPNYPQSEARDESVIRFDLANDSYVYRQYDGRAPGRPSKVLAVRQEQYRRARTGYLGGLLSLLLFRPRAAPTVAPIAAAGLLAVGLGCLLWRPRGLGPGVAM